jgi:hypothetical protein
MKGMKRMKKVRVQAFIPQLASAHAYQDSEGTGGTLAVALKRAVDQLFENPQLKAKRIHSLKLVVGVVE